MAEQRQFGGALIDCIMGMIDGTTQFQLCNWNESNVVAFVCVGAEILLLIA